MAKSEKADLQNQRNGRRIPYVLIIPAMAFPLFCFASQKKTLFKTPLSPLPNRLVAKYDPRI